ncbi:MAG: hypothetical protein ACOX3T_04975 [Bdellovibrionota bacterium]
MARNNKKRQGQKKNFYFVDKYIAGLSLTAFIVIIVAGLMHGASVITISLRAIVVILFLAVVKVMLVKILMNYAGDE